LGKDSYEKKGCFAIGLQLSVFIGHEWQRTSCMSCTIATHFIYNATQCNSIATLSKQFIFNYYATPL